MRVFLFRIVCGILRFLRPRNVKERKGVIVFKPDRIGDFILSIGALRLITREASDEVTLVLAKGMEELARHQLPHARIATINRAGDGIRGGFIRESRRFATRFASGNYRMLINLRHSRSLFDDLCLGSIRADHSIGIGDCPMDADIPLRELRTFRPVCELTYPRLGDGKLPRELEAHRRIIEAFSNRSVEIGELLPVLTGFSHFPKSGLVVLPFGSAPIRDYPIESLAEALKNCELACGIEINLLGDPLQSSRLEAAALLIQAAAPEHKVRVRRCSNILDLCAAIAGSVAVVSMESGGAHIATALDVPGVFILGGGHFGNFAPWSRSVRQRWLFHEIPCYGCNWECTRPSVECIKNIPASEVARNLQEVMAFAREAGGDSCDKPSA